MAFNTTQVMYTAMAAIFFFVLGPIVIYFTHIFWFHRHNLFITKRFPKTTLFICIVSILIIMFERTSSAISGIFRTSNHDPSVAEVLWWIHIISYSFLSHAIVWCAVARYWTMYYDFSWSIAIFDNKWKVYIDPVTFDIAHNWFIKHNATYGNIKWIGNRIKIVYTVMSCLSATIFITAKLFNYLFFSVLIDAFLFIAPLVWCLVTWCKTPRFHDSLLIHIEMKYTSILFIVGLLCYVCISGSIFLNSIIRNMLLDVFGAIIFWTYSMIATCWVSYKMKGFNRGIFLDNNQLELVKYISMSSGTLDSVQRQNNTDKQDDKKEVALEKVLCNQEYFDALIEHVINEFSLELILVIIECIQFKAFLLQNQNGFETDNKIMYHIGNAILNNDNIPKSFIVHGELNEVVNYYDMDKGISDMWGKCRDRVDERIICCQLRAYILYKKYMVNGCELEINIASIERQRLCQLFNVMYCDKMDGNTLYKVFDNVIVEMIKLLKFSYRRFKATEQYKNLLTKQSDD
eukprot:253123_1